MEVPQGVGNFHLAAYFVALANVADTDVPAVTDDILPVTNGHHFPSMPLFLYQAYASAVTLVRAKLSTPKLRQYGFSFIEPVNAALLPPTLPPIMDMWDMPLRLEKEEEVALQATDSAAGPNNAYGLIWVGRKVEAPPAGDVFTIRLTSTTAAVASVWTTLTSTFDVNLPQGLYAVIGASLEATNGIAFRLIFENQYFRPGGISQASSGLNPWPRQRRGRQGVWGYFRTNSLPRVQVLNNGTDAVHTGYLDVVRVAP